MYPEVKAFSAALDAAYAELEAGLANAPKHTSALSPEDCPGCATRTRPYAARNAALKTAWDALEASADPLVRWIAANCRDYAGAAEIVLAALPASISELDALAREQDWCEEWDNFRSAADAAGVLPKDAEVSA